jgi:AcrR family transcriptional regulator
MEAGTPQGRRTQRERREESYRRIMDTAIKLIARKGSSRTTLEEIGERSGYSHGLVSHRFGSKIALVRALTRQIQADFMAHAHATLEERSGLDAVVAMADAYLLAATAKPRSALYVLIGEAIGPVPEIRREIGEADRKFRGWVCTHIERGIEAGEIRRDVDPAAAAAVIIGILRGLTIQHLVDPHAFALEAARRELRASIQSRLQS